MSTPSQDRESSRLAEQAAEWVAQLGHMDAAQREAFARWITESRRNVEAFLFATAIERVLESPDAFRSIDIEEMLQRARTNVVPMAPSASRETPKAGNPASTGAGAHGKWRWAAGLAALAVTASAWWAFGVRGADTITTGIGEQRTVRLSDGSLLQLNTNSRVRVAFTRQGRDVNLMYGEALFTAERDPGRPFRVHAGGTVVQAIGTRFNVYHRQDGTTVAVLEGLVQISPDARNESMRSDAARSAPSRPRASLPLRLAAGHQAQLAETGRVVRLEAVDASRTMAWRERRLMFDKDTLGDIAEQFNRYNASPSIEVQGEGAANRRYTGVFDADDPSSLLEYLSRDPSLTIERREQQIVIRDSGAIQH